MDAYVPAALVAVNVPPAHRRRGTTLLQQVPILCDAPSREWIAVLYTKPGAADASNRAAGPVSIILQEVWLQRERVKETPDARDVFCFGRDKNGRSICCGVAVPPFENFCGTMGDEDILDNRCVAKVFPNLASRHRFLSTVLLLMETIRPGLGRKFRPIHGAVTDLLNVCEFLRFVGTLLRNTSITEDIIDPILSYL